MQTDIDRLKEYLPQLNPNILRKLRTYHDEMMQFNTKMNLVSAGVALTIGRQFFADAVLGVECLNLQQKLKNEVYDLGGGSVGFPGIALAILFPSIKVNYIEKDSRKQEFLKHAIQILELGNCTAVPKQVEHLPKDSVETALIRTSSPIYNTLIQMGSILKQNGSIFHFKADNWSSEVAACPTQIFTKWDISAIGSYTLPDSTIQRVIVETRRK
ncbi:MAG: class I SAM-dependent methyltransferase [Bdellovibrionales bacterium]|nr:class I SAM-dependent methyltransferase [Bdellovibrionales bacterium]